MKFVYICRNKSIINAFYYGSEFEIKFLFNNSENAMETSTIFTILGIIATIIFGILSIKLIKRNKYPGKITLVKQSVIGLFNNIAKNFEEISIKYKNAPIKENVIYLKASFINDGYLDIDGSNVEKTISLELNKGLKWIKSKVTEVSPGLNCDNEITNEKHILKFNFGLLRKKEFFQFEALIETEDEKYKAEDIFENIRIKHRISNTTNIQQTYLLSEEKIKFIKGHWKRLPSFIVGFIFVFFLTIIFEYYFIKEIDFHYQCQDSTEYKAIAQSDNVVVLDDVNSDNEKVISIQEFQDKSNYLPIIPNKKLFYKAEETIIPLLIMISILIIVSILSYFKLNKAKKIYNILTANNKE